MSDAHINQNNALFFFFSFWVGARGGVCAVGAGVHRRGVGERMERTAEVGLQ